MKKLFVLALSVFIITLTTGCRKTETEQNPPDNFADCLILGNIITMDEENPYAEAVAVSNGIILYVGSRQEAQKYCTERTRVLDYGRNSVYPGFIEGHLHGMEVAVRTQQLDLSDLDAILTTEMQDFLDRIAEYVQNNPQLDLYKGAGWSVKNGVYPTAAMLDEICNTKPMIMSSVDGHSMWINTVAIERYGVSDPANIQKYGTNCIRVDESGYPTGYISEAAMDLVRPALALSKMEYKKGLLEWQAMAFSYGITSVVEAALPINTVPIQEAFNELAEDGIWKLRTYAFEVVQYPDPYEQFLNDLNTIKRDFNRYKGEYFKVCGIKIFMDGVVEAHTAWLSEPYADNPSDYGLQAFPNPDRITEAVRFANSNGMSAHFHTIGDAAIRTAADCIIEAQNQTGITDARNTMAHLQIVKAAEIKKMGDNNIIPVVAPLWVSIEPGYFAHELEYLGADRAYSQYPIKSFFDKNCKVTFHSDFPVSPDISMPHTIYAAVTRTDEFLGPAGVNNINEAVTREQALKAVTVNAAYQLKEENRLGKLKKNYVANMSVFDADFLRDDLSRVSNSMVVATIVDGNEVYPMQALARF